MTATSTHPAGAFEIAGKKVARLGFGAMRTMELQAQRFRGLTA